MYANAAADAESASAAAAHLVLTPFNIICITYT